MDDEARTQPFWPELEEIARPAREHRRLAPAARSEIILELCARAPLSVRELSILLDRSEAYIGDAIRPLVTSGELTFLYPDQPRHPRQKYMSAQAHSLSAALDSPGLTDVFPESFSPVEAEPAPPAEVRTPTLPNQASNLMVALLTGILLGTAAVTWWWAVAAAVAVGVAGWHVAADSEQFRRFSGLSDAANKSRNFVLLKSPITFGEIALVYLLVRVLDGRP